MLQKPSFLIQHSSFLIRNSSHSLTLRRALEWHVASEVRVEFDTCQVARGDTEARSGRTCVKENDCAERSTKRDQN